jgi:hypothetical protein
MVMTEQQKETMSHENPNKNTPETPSTDDFKSDKLATTSKKDPAKKFAKIKALLATKKGKVIAAVAGVLLVLSLLLAMPLTRYALLGVVVKKDVSLTVVDSKTQKPVTEAQVTVNGQTATTDNAGKAELRGVSVGPQTITIQKKYYNGLNVTLNVWITKAAEPTQLELTANGRQVPVRVLNKITKQPLENATISALDTSVTTDANGEASLVLPADQTELEGTVAAEGYNSQTIAIKVIEQLDDGNIFSLTPAGKLYFLSKRSGKIDVMKSDLDGGNAQVVLAGTGKEEDFDTLLVASRDWKYLALKSRRDSDKAKLYLIDTTKNDQLRVIDEGDANFDPQGWADHRFVYKVTRNNKEVWENGHYALKSFNAEDGQIAQLDETQSTTSPYFNKDYRYYERYDDTLLIGNELIFVKDWSAYDDNPYGTPPDVKQGIYVINADGSNKKTLLDAWPFGDESLSIRAYKPQEIYARWYKADNDIAHYEYENGQFIKEELTNDEYYKSYPTYLISPSGNETFWSESRDGKYTLLTGNAQGDNSQTIASLVEYRQYGWFTDEYLLVSKDNSELYILSKTGSDSPLKVTDYHKPAYSLFYGGGYGGF